MRQAFRRFRVSAKRPESSNITSFQLEPGDDGSLWPARPGQYLTIRVPGTAGPLLKTYSVSCDVAEPRHYRITVKRESAPAAGLPDGVGSCWLHDRVEEGDEIEVAAPRGSFVLDEDSSRPVLLLAGGVGLTPLLSMLHALVPTGRDVWFVHACENGAVQAMREEIAQLAEGAAGRIRVCNVLREPTAEDRGAGRCDAAGLVDRALLQSLLPLDDYEVYLCGPTPFMVAMYRLLTSLGVPEKRIAYEFFGKAASLPALAAETANRSSTAASKAPASLANLLFLTDPAARALPEEQKSASAGPAVKVAADAAGANDVVFSRSGVTVAWNGARSLLELAENAGLAPDFSCREGICNTCRCTIREGEVEYFGDPLDPPASGQVLICCSRPKGRVVLDI